MSTLAAIAMALTPKAIKENLDAATELSSRMTSMKDKETILALREQISQFRELLLEATERIKELEERLKLKEQLVFERGVYWLQKDGGGKDGPFCPACRDIRAQLVRLISDQDQWYCPTPNTVCRNVFPKRA